MKNLRKELELNLTHNLLVYDVNLPHKHKNSQEKNTVVLLSKCRKIKEAYKLFQNVAKFKCSGMRITE
jgi:hypothetical protein